MPQVKYRDGMSEAARINARLKPSNDLQTADTHVQQGTGPTRVHHTVHRGAAQAVHDNPRSKSLLDDTGNMKIPTAGGPIMGSRKGKDMAKAKSGGGIRGNKNVRVNVKAGPPRSNKYDPGVIDMQGQSLAFARPPLVKGTMPQVPSGNAVAASTQCGPGGSRTIYARGVQGTHGAPAKGEPGITGTMRPSGAGKDILNEFGPNKKLPYNQG